MKNKDLIDLCGHNKTVNSLWFPTLIILIKKSKLYQNSKILEAYI